MYKYDQLRNNKWISNKKAKLVTTATRGIIITRPSPLVKTNCQFVGSSWEARKRKKRKGRPRLKTCKIDHRIEGIVLKDQGFEYGSI